MIEWVDKYSNVIQIIIGLLSLGATIFVSFRIYRLQKRHEQEIEMMEENEQKRKLEEEAHRFLIDNAEEIDYLPWCVIASNLSRHQKHTRKIYTNFCKCSIELQNEIMRVEQYNIRTIDDINWIDKAIESLRNDIKKFQLAQRDYLYDNAKYFHRAFEHYKEKKWERTPRIFEPVNKFKQFSKICFTDGKLNIGNYINEYLNLYIDKSDLCIGKPKPPFDYVWQDQKLSSIDTDEEIVCWWIMDLVFYTVMNLYNHDIYDSKILINDITDAQVNTFEDRYFQTMFVLYCIYCNS